MEKAINRTVLEELELAVEENRQILCIYCGKPLELKQRQGGYMEWIWNEKLKCYNKIFQIEWREDIVCLACGAKYPFWEYRKILKGN